MKRVFSCYTVSYSSADLSCDVHTVGVSYSVTHVDVTHFVVSGHDARGRLLIVVVYEAYGYNALTLLFKTIHIHI